MKREFADEFFTYNHQGSIIREDGPIETRSFTYNTRNQQVKVECEDGWTQVNRYDPEGLRYEMKENEKLFRFIYHRGELLYEGGKEEQTSYHLGGGTEAIQRNEKIYYYHKDEQLSTALITDEEGQVRNQYQYHAFGEEFETQESITNRIRYTGQQYDGISGQYYLRARFYNPRIGRFMQEDTYHGDGLNLYAYCHNNPVMYYDPSGYASSFDPTTYVDPSSLPGLSAGQKKTTPGIVTGAFTSSVPVGTPTISSPDGTTIAIPQEVAQQLVGKQYSSFDALREDIYIGISNLQYAGEFDSVNQTLMGKGNAPFAPGSLQTGDAAFNQMKYNIHHTQPVEDGGDVYNLDNLSIMAPKTHDEAHEQIDVIKSRNC